jgi:hypothetical protein
LSMKESLLPKGDEDLVRVEPCGGVVRAVGGPVLFGRIEVCG